MSGFRSASDRAADRVIAPAPQSHFHQACQHWCFRYGCERPVCQTCDRAAANKRMDAEYRTRLAESGR